MITFLRQLTQRAFTTGTSANDTLNLLYDLEGGPVITVYPGGHAKVQGLSQC